MSNTANGGDEPNIHDAVKKLLSGMGDTFKLPEEKPTETPAPWEPGGEGKAVEINPHHTYYHTITNNVSMWVGGLSPFEIANKFYAYGKVFQSLQSEITYLKTKLEAKEAKVVKGLIPTIREFLFGTPPKPTNNAPYKVEGSNNG